MGRRAEQSLAISERSAIGRCTACPKVTLCNIVVEERQRVESSNDNAFGRINFVASDSTDDDAPVNSRLKTVAFLNVCQQRDSFAAAFAAGPSAVSRSKISETAASPVAVHAACRGNLGNTRCDDDARSTLFAATTFGVCRRSTHSNWVFRDD